MDRPVKADAINPSKTRYRRSDNRGIVHSHTFGQDGAQHNTNRAHQLPTFSIFPSNQPIILYKEVKDTEMDRPVMADAINPSKTRYRRER